MPVPDPLQVLLIMHWPCHFSMPLPDVMQHSHASKAISGFIKAHRTLRPSTGLGGSGAELALPMGASHSGC